MRCLHHDTQSCSVVGMPDPQTLRHLTVHQHIDKMHPEEFQEKLKINLHQGAQGKQQLPGFRSPCCGSKSLESLNVCGSPSSEGASWQSGLCWAGSCRGPQAPADVLWEAKVTCNLWTTSEGTPVSSHLHFHTPSSNQYIPVYKVQACDIVSC